MTTIQNDSYRIYALGVVLAIVLGLLIYGCVDLARSKNALLEENRQLKEQNQAILAENGALNSRTLACEAEVTRLSQVEKENARLIALNLENIKKLINADQAIRTCQKESAHMLGVMKNWQLAEINTPAPAPVRRAEPAEGGSPKNSRILWLPVVLMGLVGAPGTYLALRKCSLKIY
jgi:hypothetical protein